MPFLEDNYLEEIVKDVLGKHALESASRWVSITASSNRAAQGNIRQALMARGYTLAQILAWDDVESFNEHLTVFWALVAGGATQSTDQQTIELIKLMDRRAELATVTITTDGEIVEPGDEDNEINATIRSGAMKNDRGINRDRFTFPDSWGTQGRQ